MWGISYWVFPVISGLCWLGMLLGLLISWSTTKTKLPTGELVGPPHYPSMSDNQTIAFISDVGAERLKPLFIAGSIVTTVFLDLAFLSERWLRHRGRLAKNTTSLEKALSALGIIFAIFGSAGLILLSIFDTLRYPTAHDCFLLLFIAGYIISAVFICWEYQRLGIHFREHRILRASFWIKLTFILLEVALAIAFAACNFAGAKNAAAVLEWAVSFIFTFYIFSFFVDLIPAVKTKSSDKRFKGSSGETEMQMEQNDGAAERERTGARNEERRVGNF